MDYDGGRTRSDIVSRAMDLFSDNAPPPELLEVSKALPSDRGIEPVIPV